MDLDPQGQCAIGLGTFQKNSALRLFSGSVPSYESFPLNKKRKRLYLLPGDKSTVMAQPMIARDTLGISYLSTLLRTAIPNEVHIVIDTSPSIGGLKEQAIFASDYLLIPCVTDYLSLEGVANVVNTTNVLRQTHGWTGQVCGILPTFYDNTKESHTNLTQLLNTYPDIVLPPIHRAAVLREAAATGSTIFEYSKSCRAANEYHRLAMTLARLT